MKWAKSRAQPEGKVKSACIAWLCLHGCEIISNTTGTAFRDYTTKSGEYKRYPIRFGKKGSGDIIACGPNGRYVEVETKIESGKLSPEQKIRKEIIESRQGVYVVALTLDHLEERKADIIAGSW